VFSGIFELFEDRANASTRFGGEAPSEQRGSRRLKAPGSPTNKPTVEKGAGEHEKRAAVEIA